MTDRKKGWGRKLKLASVPIVLASLAACATPFNADVSRFQTQLPAPQGESYFVVADDPALAGGHVDARLQPELVAAPGALPVRG